jgi:hypothetical protein
MLDGHIQSGDERGFGAQPVAECVADDLPGHFCANAHALLQTGRPRSAARQTRVRNPMAMRGLP